MSHDSQRAWVAKARQWYPSHFSNCRVLEIGSYNVNGTVRDFFTDCDYVGADVIAGPCVDLVCRNGYAAWAEVNQVPEAFDTVISCEALEHDQYWRATLEAAYIALRPGALMVLTVAGPGRPEHGTLTTTPQDAPGLPWPTYYRNLSLDDLRGALTADMFSERHFDSNTHPDDTYFAGIKRLG